MIKFLKAITVFMWALVIFATPLYLLIAFIAWDLDWGFHETFGLRLMLIIPIILACVVTAAVDYD